ncbi:MAG TPA: hypothetical protein VGN90_03805 [Pyrinomonadaceae bacterium]|jgi:hypothetical protein|nr:hypothetical protein [Pyrinomonadaceae bacterium]
MNNKLKPALLGGLIVGVLSAIPFINYCCCIWSIGGGALAAYLYIKSSPVPVSMGDGAMVGGLAGVVGGIIYLILGLPIALVFGMASMTESLNRSGVQLPVSGFLLIIVAAIVGAIILALLATLGGVIGVAIFEKRKGDGLAPPPPQNYAA